MSNLYIVLGARGYIGRKFTSYLKSRGMAVEALSRNTIDYTDIHGFREYLNYNRPRWAGKDIFIINCAGKTGRPNVDQCEIKKQETIHLNVMLPAMLSELCFQQKITFCHVSSGCIYSGTGSRPFSEEDKPNFTFNNKVHSFYSGTKAMAEEYIRENPHSYIWRIRMPFDEFDNRRNYISKIISYDKALDATNSLTHIGDFLRTCHGMLEQGAPYGTYNIVNDGSITTRDIVSKVKKVLDIDKKFSFFKSHKAFLETVDTPRSNCVLKCDKVNSLIGVSKMRDVNIAIDDTLDNWRWQS